MTNADLLLHPVRLRVVQAFLGGRELTTSQLRHALSDVPPATIYRQVATLVEGSVLMVLSERKIRGAVERTYRLNEGNANISADEASRMDADAHRRAFMTFIAGLLGDFDRYLDQDNFDLMRDGVGYRQLALHLTDGELAELVADLSKVLMPRMDLPPSSKRVRRLLSTILMPSE